MNILAFDTCLDKTYITLRNETSVIDSRTILSRDENYHSAYLISTIKDVLRQADFTPKDLDIIATDIGPGSFTGIRACTTVARVLAQQLDIKTVGISSLEILSKILGGNDMVALDARKNKAYLYDGQILGAIELEKVDKIVKDKIIITDNSLLERFKDKAQRAVSYQSSDYPLGEILGELALSKTKEDWRMLKPLYIQPPPVFGK